MILKIHFQTSVDISKPTKNLNTWNTLICMSKTGINVATEYFRMLDWALRTTLEVCMSVCLSACLSVSISFFAIYSKNLQATQTSKSLTVCNIFWRMPLWKKKIQKFCVRGCTALFGHQVQNNFFALIKKIFLQPLIEITFRYHKIFF